MGMIIDEVERTCVCARRLLVYLRGRSGLCLSLSLCRSLSHVAKKRETPTYRDFTEFPATVAWLEG